MQKHFDKNDITDIEIDARSDINVVIIMFLLQYSWETVMMNSIDEAEVVINFVVKEMASSEEMTGEEARMTSESTSKV